MEPYTYQKAGVDINKADAILDQFSDYLKSRPRDPNIVSGIGGFAACYDLKPILKEISHPLLVTCCDGVGTKVKLALEWNCLEGLGDDLVAMNVNDLLCCGALPLVFLDYYACGSLDEKVSLTLLHSIQRACEKAGCSLIGGETAEMPGIYAPHEFDLAGFSVGLADKNNVLGPSKVRHEDRLIALESSGPHSNGFSLIRKLIEKEKINPQSTACFESRSWRDIVLAPTIIYVPYLKNLLSTLHALAHLTGGGLTGNLPRILPNGSKAIVRTGKWPLPPFFKWVQEKANLNFHDLLTTLNCGVGMVLVCAPKDSENILEHLSQQKLKAWDIGEVRLEGGAEPAQVIWE